MPNEFDTSAEPLGSTSPYVLYNNAGNEDLFVNDVVNETWVDRPPFNRVRKTIYGMEQDFLELLAASGFETDVLTYTDGVPLTVDRPTQLIERASDPGNLYSVKLPSTFPVNLSGTWATDEPLLVVRSDQALRSELADFVNPDKGAAIVGRAVRTVESIAQLQTAGYEGLRDGDTVLLLGYYADTPGYGGGHLYWNSASTATPTLGTIYAVSGVAVGRWVRANLEESDLYQWGARQSEESSTAIQAAFDWVRTRGWGTVDTGSGGFFLTDKPLRVCQNLHIKGKGIIRAVAPFSSVTFDIDGGGTLTVAPVLYAVDTVGTVNPFKVGAAVGSRRFGLIIDQSVEIDARNIAGVGIFLDNYIDYKIDCRIKTPTKWGVWHYFFGWGGQIHAYITAPGEGGVWLGDGCNGINLDHMKVFGDTGTPSVTGLLIDGNNNGLSCSGTFIEKVATGAILRNMCGPIDLSGIDFEVITGNTVRCEGGSTIGRQMGPVTISGCLIETSSPSAALIYANNAVVIARGNRMRNAAKAFEVVGNGYIVDEDNTFVNITQIGANRVFRKGVVGSSLFDHNYSQAGSSLVAVRDIANYSYSFTPSLVSSGLKFSHAVTDSGAQRMVGSSTWFVADMLGGAESNRMGVALAYTGGGTNKRFVPIDDNLTDCGFTGMRWRTVYAGTGTISTSDAREKTVVRGLSSAEIGAAKDLAKEIGAFKFLSAVAAKGEDARDHIGMTVQRAIEVMESHGLNPHSYSFICFDKWDAQPAQRGFDGSISSHAVEAGELYSFRMDGLLAFVAAGFEARLSALESK